MASVPATFQETVSTDPDCHIKSDSSWEVTEKPDPVSTTVTSISSVATCPVPSSPIKPLPLSLTVSAKFSVLGTEGVTSHVDDRLPETTVSNLGK